MITGKIGLLKRKIACEQTECLGCDALIQGDVTDRADNNIVVLKRSMLPLGKSLELGSLLPMIIHIFGYTPINCAPGRPLRGQKRLAPLAKRSTCRKSNKLEGKKTLNHVSR